jgi:DNA-binding protein YbaB
MGLAQQAGLADEANNLQREIANLDARLQTRGQDISREGLSLQNNLANLDASTRIYLGDLNAQMQQQGVSAQERMARMDAELRRHGIDVQGNLGLMDTVLRGQLGNRQIDLDYDRLGVDVADIRRQMNRDAVIGGLQG